MGKDYFNLIGMAFQILQASRNIFNSFFGDIFEDQLILSTNFPFEKMGENIAKLDIMEKLPLILIRNF